MTVLNKLASSLNRRDEVPNQELAKQMASKADSKGIKELIDNLTNKKLQNDCIKVLYEIGELDPKLIAGYIPEFTSLLTSKNNRLQWGGMTALSCITTINPKGVYSLIPKITDAADKGSVITRDRAVKILITLCGFKQYTDNVFPLLVEQLLSCPTNQLPMYAENAIPVINEKNQPMFIKTLKNRIAEIEKDSQRKRIEKVLKKIASNN